MRKVPTQLHVYFYHGGNIASSEYKQAKAVRQETNNLDHFPKLLFKGPPKYWFISSLLQDMWNNSICFKKGRLKHGKGSKELGEGKEGYQWGRTWYSVSPPAHLEHGMKLLNRFQTRCWGCKTKPTLCLASTLSVLLLRRECRLWNRSLSKH